MANRHKVAKKNVGGAMVASGNPKVIAEAKKKKDGGAIDEKAEGGAVAAKPEKKAEGGKVAGKKAGGRLDKRARGGGVGADQRPFSSAHIGSKKG